jgi:hypothetical protein
MVKSGNAVTICTVKSGSAVTIGEVLATGYGSLAKPP